MDSSKRSAATSLKRSGQRGRRTPRTSRMSEAFDERIVFNAPGGFDNAVNAVDPSGLAETSVAVNLGKQNETVIDSLFEGGLGRLGFGPQINVSWVLPHSLATAFTHWYTNIFPFIMSSMHPTTSSFGNRVFLPLYWVLRR